MEIWFWAAGTAALFSGLANFVFKLAAKNNYNPENFQFFGGVFTSLYLIPIALIFSTFYINPYALAISFLAGFVAASGGIGKVYALRFIDTTIYFPLFKLVSPLLAIIIGIFLFGETFTKLEWIGLLIGLLVPLLLINKTEKGRQKHLLFGLALVLLTGLISAGSAAANKLAIDIAPFVLPNLAAVGMGIMMGSVTVAVFKKGLANAYKKLITESDKELMFWSAIRSVLISSSLGLVLFAYATGGTLAIVHTILSLYILITIVLSIIFFNEHWNLQKVIAIILSVAALVLLG